VGEGVVKEAQSGARLWEGHEEGWVEGSGSGIEMETGRDGGVVHSGMG